MKKILLISFLALLACSCVRITKFDASDDFEFCQYEKKVDGKKRYGVIFKNSIKFMLGEYAFLEEETKFDPLSSGVIPCIYDSISLKMICEKEYMFVCQKDGQTYYYSQKGAIHAGGNPVTKIEYMGDSSRYYCFGHTHDFKFYTEKGIYTKSAGPHEDICISYYGYAIKENGKWGFVRDYEFWNIGDDEPYKQVLPCEFDELADVLDLTQYNTVITLARKGTTWECYDGKGQKIPIKKEWLNTVIRTKKQKNLNQPIYRVVYK
ncbi:MAG: hypothetical protein E7019_00320 [Alphaproteobacteria bacterium]|nr:hypothetical protein [Alphaproteobacteria bacterium]